MKYGGAGECCGAWKYGDAGEYVVREALRRVGVLWRREARWCRKCGGRKARWRVGGRWRWEQGGREALWCVGVRGVLHLGNGIVFYE